MRCGKQLKSLVKFQEFEALQTQAEHLHTADQAAIVMTSITTITTTTSMTTMTTETAISI